MSEKEIFLEESDGDVDIPKEKRKLTTASYDYSVDYVAQQMIKDSPKIILEVPFQRNQVWKSDRSSQLIESIIMNVPIPPLYFSEEDDGTWLVVDGLQRLLAIKTFYQNEFPLKNLEIVKELEDFKFKDLPGQARELLKDGMLRINVIKKESHPDIKYDIFMRLNKGAMSLNNQELRNCLYRGSLNDLLRGLVREKEVLGLLNQQEPHNRYLDVEFLLRYLAFSANLKKKKGGYFLAQYSGSLKSFLNDFMDKNKNCKQEVLNQLKNKILSTFERVKLAFGNEGLRIPKSGSSKINKAFADCILLGFENMPEDKIRKKRTDLIEKRDQLLDDEKFVEAITKRTSDSRSIEKRIKLWFEAINDVV